MKLTSKSRSAYVAPVFVAAVLVCAAFAGTGKELPAPLENVHRILFLGDSITYAGEYIEDVQAYLDTRFPEYRFEILNLGLPSETVSGLSEPGHAGGRFPRPDLHERLIRVLRKTKPDLVFACYGMNDGIYEPFSIEHFRKFQEGMEWLHEQVAATGARIVHITPPVFDALAAQALKRARGEAASGPPYRGYNSVLDRYSAWLLAQRSAGWEVIDLHGPMNRWLAEHRKRDPNFSYTRDGVHPDAAGHWVIARCILNYLGAKDAANAPGVEAMLSNQPHGAEILKLIQQEQRMTKDAWLSYTGYRRPGMKRGLPIEQARAEAAAMEKRIKVLVRP